MEKETGGGIVEFSGFYIKHSAAIEAHDQEEGLNPTWSQGPLEGVFTIASDYFLKFSTDTGNFEANWKRDFYKTSSTTLKWLAGLRYTSVTERLQVDNWDNADPDATELGYFHVRTINHMVGAQVGAEYKTAISRWTLSASAKIGLLLNWSKADKYQNDPQNPETQNIDMSKTATAWSTVTEASVGAGYNLTPNLQLYAKGSVYYLTGIATVAKNIPNTTEAWSTNKTNGHALSYGPEVGASYRF